MNILFVCTGNISRSFLAEILLTREIQQRKLHNISVSSAGLFAYPGNSPDPKMVALLTKNGITTKDHKAKQITKQDIDWADHILVMEEEHLHTINSSWPGVTGKVELLGNYISKGNSPVNIMDPFGRSPYHYRLALSQITLAINSLLKGITLGQPKNHHAQDQIHRC